ncbi:MAG: hypothetical protein J6T88_00155 [Bacteroidales bacterium]|nr:hypothetical protein [Bacteroidales bacterium]
MNILDLSWCIVYRAWERYPDTLFFGGIKDPVFQANSFIVAFLSLYLLEILIVCLVAGIWPLNIYALLIAIAFYAILLLVFFKRNGSKEQRKSLQERYEQYKKEHPVLRLVRFWAFVLGPFALIFLSVVVS